MPAATHTERTPPTLGTYRLISEGCTKIEAPMMMPATIAVACSRPMGRSKTGGFPGAVKMRQCTKKENRIFTAEAREGVRHRSGGEGSPNRSRDRKGALLALPIDLTLPYGRGSDWSTPYARIFSLGRHLRKALTYVSRTRVGGRGSRNGRHAVSSFLFMLRLLVFGAFALMSPAQAQTLGEVRGSVVDARGGEALAKVEILLGSGSYRTTTDSTGHFVLY